MKRKISLLSLLLVAALVLGMVPFGAFRTEAYAATADGDGTTAGEEASFDVQGSKEASPTELDPTQRETTVTLQLPAGQYKNEYDIVFVMDSSSSTTNSDIDFAVQVAELHSELIKKDAVLNVGVIKCRGRAFDTISLASKNQYNGLVEYSKETSEVISNGINYAEAELEKISSGTNMHGGLKMADEWLSADETIPDDHKFVILLMDGKTYIWNNEKDEPTTYYTQYQGKNGAVYGAPAVGQQTGAYSKSAYKHKDTYYYTYTTTNAGIAGSTAVTVSDMSKCFYSPFYTDIYSITDNEELSKTDTKYDFYCYYADYGKDEKSAVASAKGTLDTYAVTNGAGFTYNIHKKYYKFTPQDDLERNIKWTELKWLEAAPYEVVENEDGTYSYNLEKPNPDFYQVHPDSLQKALYLTGHLWTDMVEKYNAGAIIYNGWGGGSGLETANTFNQWILSKGISDYAADITNTASVAAIFESIKDEILYMISSGVVTDTITNDFTLKNADNADGFRMTLNGEELDVEFNNGVWGFGTLNEGIYPYAVSYDDSSKTITWEINVPVENVKPVTLSYDLIISENAETGEYDTNVSAILDYKSTDGKKDGTYPFPVPKVNYKATAEYYVKHLELGTNIPVYDEEHGSAVVGSMVTAAAINIPDDGWALAPDQPESQDLLITSVAANNVITFLYTVQNSSYVTLHYDATQYKPQATEEENNKAIIKKVIDPKEVQVGTYVTGSAIRLPEYPTKDGIFYVYTESPYEADGCTIKENKDQNVLRFFYNPIIVTINHWLEDYTAPASGNAAGSSSSLKGNAGLAAAATTANASKYGLYTTTTASGKLDVEYVAEKLNPSGYHFDQAVTDVLGQDRGIITEKGLVLNLYYSKDQAPTPDPRPNPRPNPNPNPDPTDEPEPIDDPDTPLAPSETEDTEIDDGDTPLAPSETEDTEIDEEATPLSPFTGDSRHTAVWAGISVAALLGIIFLGRKRKING